MSFKIKTLHLLLQGNAYNNDNLHHIAISNLRDHERQIIRWWKAKYRQPEKPLDEHTIEELMVEMLEDYYERHPVEVDRFLAGASGAPDWDGCMSADYEREIQARLKKLNVRPADLKKYQSDVELTPEQEKEIFESLGRNLPKSKALTKRENEPLTLGNESEFEDTF
jgi:chorismate mutase